MKISILTAFALFTSAIVAAPQSSSSSSNLNDISVREASPLENFTPLEKRKGGGGGKGGGSSSGGKGGTSGSSGSSGGKPLSSYSFSPSSNVGGRTRGGSGTPPAYGSRYAGGAVVPYTAGARSPTRGVLPYALPIAGLGIFPGLWLYGSLYAYPYGYGYHWNDGRENRTSNVTCLCQRYQVCGCDPQDNSTFLNKVVANGVPNGPPVNSSTVRTAVVNGTEQTFINGSLANGTTASGGTDPSNASQVSAAVQNVMGYAGYWLMVVTVVASVWMV